MTPNNNLNFITFSALIEDDLQSDSHIAAWKIKMSFTPMLLGSPIVTAVIFDVLNN